MLVVRSGKTRCFPIKEELQMVTLVQVGLQAQIQSRLLQLCFVLQIMAQSQSKFLQLYFEPQSKVQILLKLLQFYSISLCLKPNAPVQDSR